MISASQMSAAKCPRKWAFKSIAHFAYTPGPAAEFGLRGHAQAERWLEQGISPDLSPEGRLFAEGIHLLPRPGACMVEVDLTGARKPKEGHGKPLIIDGVPFIGYIDVLGLVGDTPLVIDHKFTSRPRNALTVDGLRKNEQGILYPFAASRLFDARSCASRWVYYPRDGSRVFPVDDLRYREEIEDAFYNDILPFAKVLHTIKSLAPKLKPDSGGLAWVNTVPCNPSVCDWSGRFCDWANLCTKRNESMSTLEELKARLQQVQQGQAPQQAPQQQQMFPQQAQQPMQQPPPQFQQQQVAVNPPEMNQPPPQYQQPQPQPAPSSGGLAEAISALKAAASNAGLTLEITLR